MTLVLGGNEGQVWCRQHLCGSGVCLTFCLGCMLADARAQQDISVFPHVPRKALVMYSHRSCSPQCSGDWFWMGTVISVPVLAHGVFLENKWHRRVSVCVCLCWRVVEWKLGWWGGEVGRFEALFTFSHWNDTALPPSVIWWMPSPKKVHKTPNCTWEGGATEFLWTSKEIVESLKHNYISPDSDGLWWWFRKRDHSFYQTALKPTTNRTLQREISR